MRERLKGIPSVESLSYGLPTNVARIVKRTRNALTNPLRTKWTHILYYKRSEADYGSATLYHVAGEYY